MPGSTIEIISATRLNETDFREKSALGRSLKRLAFDRRLAVRVVVNNTRGLPDIFNARIQAPDGGELLVFVHDDVWIDDFFVADRVIEGLASYDIIGVAGNRRRIANQPAWAFVDTKWTVDERTQLSGAVAHGEEPFGAVSWFGSTPAECELLDGMFLAARKSSLVTSGVRFDPQFDFHFYDMDFCRSARQKGLRLGTWPICLTHQSAGSFGTPSWIEKYQAYLSKWGS